MGLQDANPRARTYGCCDRYYWQYKTISSFPAATFQQLALPFAVLHACPFEGNTYCSEPAMLRRAIAAMDFWCDAQHADGSFDEWYRNEHSYCPTAFTTWAMTECLLILGERVPPECRGRVTAHIRRAAAWLGRRFNADVMNQNLAACAAMHGALCLQDDASLRESLERTWRRTLEHQHAEGWFLEYGGADAGYSLLALDLLACMDRRGMQGACESAERLCNWLQAFICRSGGLAGRLGSRGTEHAFPFGAEHFAARSEAAGRIAAHLRAAFSRGELTTPAAIDDRYFAYFYLPQFALAASLNRIETAPAAPAQRGDTSWPAAGFRVHRTTAMDVVCSLRRQGALNAHAAGLPVFCDMGYWAQTRDGRRFSSAGWNPDALDITDLPDGFTVRGAFIRVKDDLPLVRHPVAFHALSSWVLRWPALAERVQGFIKRRKVVTRAAAPLRIERRIHWHGDELHLHDAIIAEAACPPISALTPVSDIDVHSPSARIYAARPITGRVIDERQSAEWASLLTRTGRIDIETRLSPDSQGKAWRVHVAQSPQGANA